MVQPYAQLILQPINDFKEEESGTDVFRSFTRVYVVFRIENKPNTRLPKMQVNCQIIF